jgi:diguanylate cyclase (GGDEF)-like protein/PAS domain S-box-containing protein
MTDLSNCVSPHSRLFELFRYTMLLPWLVLVACLAATLLLWDNARQSVLLEIQADFDSRAHEAIDSVEQRMKSYEQVLRGADGVFAAFGKVGRSEFLTYVNALNIESGYPGMQGLGFVQVVPSEQKNRFIANIRKEGFTEYTIRPGGMRDIYASVTFIEPFNESNQRDFGYDMFSDSVYPLSGDSASGIRRSAMEQARDTGNIILSGKVKRLMEDGPHAQPGFMMYYPVYKNDSLHDTLTERRANIIGWVYAPFSVEKMMDGILGEIGSDVDIEIFDGERMDEQAIMYDPDSSVNYSSDLIHGEERPKSLFHTTSRIELAGHYWTVAVRSLDGFEMRLNSDKPKFIAFAGIGASLLLALLTWLLVYGRTRAMQDAQEITRSEERLAAVIDTALDAVVEIDADGIITGWNSQAEKIFGWSRDEAIGRALHEVIIFPLNGMWHILNSSHGSMLDSRVEMTAMRLDGRKFPIELAITRITVDGGYRFSTFIRDITERKQTEESLMISEQRFRMVSEAAGEYLWETDAHMVYTYVSSKSVDVKGYTPEELIGRRFTEFMEESDVSSVVGVINQSIASKAPFSLQHRGITQSGSILWEEVGGIPIFDGNGVLTGFRGAGLDITERKLAEDELRLASLVYENSSEAMAIADENKLIIAVNPAFEKLTGYTREEVIGKYPGIFNSRRNDHTFYRRMWQAITSTGYWHGEMWSKRKNGEGYIQLLTINTIKSNNGSVLRYAAQFSDITKKKESEELIWKQANFDALTGLPNRSMFSDRLVQEINKTNLSGQSLALMFIDLDRFKEINDTLGHDMGDMLLQEAAQRLSSCVRTTDTVARLGGDEFTVIMGGLEDHNNVELIAQDILLKLAEPFLLGSETAYVSASIGITFYPEHASTIDELLKHADQAMYLSKHKGRNRYSYFTPSMRDASHARLRLINHLHGALAANQFRVHYQPIVQLATGTIHKAEALIRWQHPELGMVSPAEFIPLAEETGLIKEIGDWVFREAARQVAQWRESHHAAFQISVNKSPVQFHDDDHIHSTWLDYLQSLGLPGQSIAVEITEGLLLDGNTAVIERLLGFRDSGIQVSLDDFGTGYSSLSYLKKFHIDYIKIDQSFVRNLAPGSEDTALCEAIIVMGHKLGLKVVAEGIETVEQRDLLVAAGCDYGQGYLFSNALPPDEFEALLDKQSMGDNYFTGLGFIFSEERAA